VTMKIGEFLELTKVKNLATIAKEDLSIGEKFTRLALANAGCYSISGKRGWYFDGDPEVLEKSIYDFVEVKAKTNAKPKEQKSKRTKKINVKKTNDSKNKSSKTTINEKINEEKKVERKRFSFDLDVELAKELKIKAVMEEKNLYELVEEAIRESLTKGKVR
ncbi:hypothetical protein, partial [Priestia megaterium]|uniref:hypothetical protein n=1 Tax=Priestia megaterium TaxID=1404 RepID=UPI003D01DBAA